MDNLTQDEFHKLKAQNKVIGREFLIGLLLISPTVIGVLFPSSFTGVLVGLGLLFSPFFIIAAYRLFNVRVCPRCDVNLSPSLRVCRNCGVNLYRVGEKTDGSEWLD